MAVSTTTTYSGPYFPNGVTVAFPFNFQVVTADEIAVILRADGVDTAADPAAYTVTLAEGGGTVTFASAPASGSELYVTSDPLFTQTAIFSNQAYNPEALNALFDRDAVRAQHLKGLADRAVSARVGEVGGVLPSMESGVGKFLARDAAGNWLWSSGTGADAGLRGDLAANGTDLVNAASGQTVQQELDARPTSVALAAYGAADGIGYRSGSVGAALDTITSDLALAGALRPVTVSRPRAGRYALHASFNDPLNINYVICDGQNWRYERSPYDAMDFTKFNTCVERFVSYATGNDANDGLTSGTAWKTLDKVAASAPDLCIVNLLDDKVGMLSASSTSGAPLNMTTRRVKFRSAHSGGVTRWSGYREDYTAASFAWVAHGAGNARKSNAVGPAKNYAAQFDSKYLDHAGVPTPLIAAANATAVETTPGSFFWDGTYLYVHMIDGRVPDPADGWIFLTNDRGPHIQCDSPGVMLFENIEFSANSNNAVLQAFRFRPLTTGAPNTIKVGFRNCKFYGGSANGLQVYDVLALAVENCVSAYNFNDGLNYHSFISTGAKGSWMTVYEQGNKSYSNGYRGWAVTLAVSGSDNASTCHDRIQIARVGCSYPTNNGGGVVADVTGCLSLNYGIATGPIDAIGAFYPAAFAHEGETGAANEMHLIGCIGAGDAAVGSYAIEAGSQSTVFVDQWLGEANARIRRLDTGVIKRLSDSATLFPVA